MLPCNSPDPARGAPPPSPSLPSHSGRQDFGRCTSLKSAGCSAVFSCSHGLPHACGFCFVHFYNSSALRSLLIPLGLCPSRSASSPRSNTLQLSTRPGPGSGPARSLLISPPHFSHLSCCFRLSSVPCSPCHVLGLLLSRDQPVPLAPECETLSPVMLWLALGPFHAMENQVLVIRIKIPNSGAVDWTVHSGPQLLFRDVLVSGNFSGQIPASGLTDLDRQLLGHWWPELASGGVGLLVSATELRSLKLVNVQGPGEMHGSD